MYNKTTIVITAIVFALVGTMIFSAVAPYLATEVDARPPIKKTCNENSPNGGFSGPPCGGIKM